MPSPTWTLGYHGCDRSVAEALLAGRTILQVSRNDYDWLGTGIYFWERDAPRALAWAEFVKTHPEFSATGIQEPAVVGAVIDLGYCLDLLESESIRLVKEAYGKLSQILTALELRCRPTQVRSRTGRPED